MSNWKIVLAILVIGLVCSVAQADNIIISGGDITACAYGRDDIPDTAAAGGFMYPGGLGGASARQIRGFFAADISAIDPSWTIDDVTVSFAHHGFNNNFNGDQSDVSLDLYSMTAGTLTNTSTWNDASAMYGSSIAANMDHPVHGSSQYFNDAALTAYLQSSLAGGVLNMGMVCDELALGSERAFFSLKNPHLDVTYTVPEPATMALLGLGSLVALKRRRR